MKRSLFPVLFLFCAIALIVFVLHSTNDPPSAVYEIGEDGDAASGNGPISGISEETLRALEAASPDAWVMFNGETGEITIIEPDADSGVQSTKPHTPDGLEATPGPTPPPN